VPTKILFSEAGVDIITQPFLVGDELSRLARAASKDWLASLPPAALKGALSLEILNGGRHYYVTEAYGDLLGDRCPVMSIRAKRGHASAENYGGPAHLNKDIPKGTELYQSPQSDWCVRIWEQKGEITGTLLVADTIATGTTLAGVLGWAVQKMEASGNVHDIYLFTIAGASHWPENPADGGLMPKLEALQATLRKYGKSLHITFANARFVLAKNGTDLGVLGADIEPRARALMSKRWPEKFLPYLRCVVWDWGDRFDASKIAHHLDEIHTYYRAQPHCPPDLLRGIETRLAVLPRYHRHNHNSSRYAILSLYSLIGLAAVTLVVRQLKRAYTS